MLHTELNVQSPTFHRHTRTKIDSKFFGYVKRCVSKILHLKLLREEKKFTIMWIEAFYVGKSVA